MGREAVSYLGELLGGPAASRLPRATAYLPRDAACPISTG